MIRISKIILIILLIEVCLISFSSVYAFSTEYYRPDNPTGYTNFFKKAGNILGVVRNIGAVVSVLGIAVLGLRYMLGSLEQKANYKETMVPFVIGIIITVGMTTIITIVKNVAEKL